MHPLRRGSVVMRDGCIGVVWDPRPASLSILPIRQRRPRRASDVSIEELHDRIATRLRRAGCVLAARPIAIPPDCEYLGEATGELMCRVTQAVIRAAGDALVEERRSGDRRHRDRAADERCAV